MPFGLAKTGFYREFHMNKDMINLIRQKLNTGGRRHFVSSFMVFRLALREQDTDHTLQQSQRQNNVDDPEIFPVPGLDQ